MIPGQASGASDGPGAVCPPRDLSPGRQHARGQRLRQPGHDRGDNGLHLLDRRREGEFFEAVEDQAGKIGSIRAECQTVSTSIRRAVSLTR